MLRLISLGILLLSGCAHDDKMVYEPTGRNQCSDLQNTQFSAQGTYCTNTGGVNP